MAKIAERSLSTTQHVLYAWNMYGIHFVYNATCPTCMEHVCDTSYTGCPSSRHVHLCLHASTILMWERKKLNTDVPHHRSDKHVYMHVDMSQSAMHAQDKQLLFQSPCSSLFTCLMELKTYILGGLQHVDKGSMETSLPCMQRTCPCMQRTCPYMHVC